MSRSVQDDGYLSTDSSLSSDEDDRPLRSRPRPRPAKHSNMPCIVGGVVVVLLAAIGATVYILSTTRQGGALRSGLSSSSTPQAVSKPLTSSPSLDTGSDEVRNEEEEDSRATPKPRPSSTEEEEMESPQASKSREGGEPAKPTSDSSVSGGGSDLPTLFGNDLNVDFGSLTSADELDNYLSENGLWISDYGTVNIGPLLHGFHKENTDWVDGAISMKVVGQQGEGEVSSSEFATKDKFLYGRVTTRFRASPVPGVCHGIFWYGVSYRAPPFGKVFQLIELPVGRVRRWRSTLSYYRAITRKDWAMESDPEYSLRTILLPVKGPVR